MSQFFHKLLGYKGTWTLSCFQVNSLRVQANQLQNPRDFKARKNQNGIKLKNLSTFPGKAKISGQDLSKSWFCKIKSVERNLWIGPCWTTPPITRGVGQKAKSPQDLEQFYFLILNFLCSEICEESCALETPGAFPLTSFPRMSQVTLSRWDGIIPFLSLGPWFGSSAHFRLGRDTFPPLSFPGYTTKSPRITISKR